MNDDPEDVAKLERLWHDGVDIRDAWKELIPVEERRTFDNLDSEDADYALFEEASGYKASLIEGLNAGRHLAIGRTGLTDDAGFKRVPPSACYKGTLIIHKGCVNAANLSLERVVVLLDQVGRSPIPTVDPVSPDIKADCEAELSRLDALAVREKPARGRTPVDSLLMEAARALLRADVPIHRGPRAPAGQLIIVWLQTNKRSDFPGPGKPTPETLRKFMIRYGIGGSN